MKFREVAETALERHRKRAGSVLRVQQRMERVCEALGRHKALREHTRSWPPLLLRAGELKMEIFDIC